MFGPPVCARSAPRPDLRAPAFVLLPVPRWQASGGAERANYGLFLNDLTALLGIAR